MNARGVVATLLSLLLLGQVLSAEVHGASAPGLVIKNRAEISYIDGATGETLTSYSNVAQLRVTELYRFSLVGEQNARTQRNTSVQLVHQIHNIGNVADGYSLALSGVNGSLQLPAATVHEDINGNGIVDAGEPPIDRTPLIQPGALVQLIVLATVPESAPDNAMAQIQLSAESVYAELPAQLVVDTVTVVSGLNIDLAMTTSPECGVPVFPGERISYTTNYINQGHGLPEHSSYLVDGSLRHGVLLSSAVPANTTLDKVELPNYSASTSLVVCVFVEVLLIHCLF